jgi:hypothetical protein
MMIILEVYSTCYLSNMEDGGERREREAEGEPPVRKTGLT